MNDDVLYEHNELGRRPLTLAVGLACLGMTAVGLWGGAPWYWWVPVGGATLGIGWVLLVNQQSGSVLTRDALRLYHGGYTRVIPVSDIAKVELHRATDGPDEVNLILADGEQISVPSWSRGRGLVDALRKLGVALG